jgi:hypothetical protein
MGVVVLATLAAACGGMAATPLASGAAPSPVAASPSPVRSPVQPIILSGSNSRVTDPMEIPPGNYRVSWQATDTQQIGGTTVSELFEVYVQGQQKTNIVNEVLPTPSSGEALFSSAGGSFIVDVEVSSATWKITFTWLSP